MLLNIQNCTHKHKTRELILHRAISLALTVVTVESYWMHQTKWCIQSVCFYLTQRKIWINFLSMFSFRCSLICHFHRCSQEVVEPAPKQRARTSKYKHWMQIWHERRKPNTLNEMHMKKMIKTTRCILIKISECTSSSIRPKWGIWHNASPTTISLNTIIQCKKDQREIFEFAMTTQQLCSSLFAKSIWFHFKTLKALHTFLPRVSKSEYEREWHLPDCLFKLLEF